MFRLRTVAVLACVSAALVVGLGTPAQAATKPAAVAGLSGYQFGVYYTLWACQYFGNSLVQGGAFKTYYCQYEWRSGEPQGYYYLYVY